MVDLGGNYLAPGFIDLHVHGAMGHDTMEATEEAFRTIIDYHLGGGTTSLLLTTVTAPIGQIVDAVTSKLRRREDCFRSCAERTWKGLSFRGKNVARSRRRLSSSRNRNLVRQLLELQEHHVRRLTLAPEVAGAAGLDFERLTKIGIAASGGHSNAWEEEARAAFDRGMRQVTHTFNCMSSLRRRDGERVAGLLEFALSEPKIFCELIADGHHVGTTLMRMLYQAKGAHKFAS